MEYDLAVNVCHLTLLRLLEDLPLRPARQRRETRVCVALLLFGGGCRSGGCTRFLHLFRSASRRLNGLSLIDGGELAMDFRLSFLHQLFAQQRDRLVRKTIGRCRISTEGTEMRAPRETGVAGVVQRPITRGCAAYIFEVNEHFSKSSSRHE